MLFTSVAFLIFLPAVFMLYWFVCGRSVNWQNRLLLLSSYIFYGWWNWKFTGLLLLSTLIDYSFGFLVAKGPVSKRKLFLILSLINNLLVLCIFKYYNFFISEAGELLGRFGMPFHPYLIRIILPVGISFYTFHGMSYVIDIYRNKLEPVKSFVEYALFVSFFPLLVAGPIERATHLLPQVRQPRTFQRLQAVQGLRLMLWGFFKKMVIADTLGPIVDDIFAHYTGYSGSVLALGSVYFAFQIYCDFSGYTDIALGVAKLFGFELLTNFKFPYFSRDVAEFWRRWHISLSSWFRDYVYIPLGGSRVGRAKAIRNTFIIFLLSGLWHGANWTYVAWGAFHAVGFLPLLLLRRNRRNTGEIVAHDRLLPTWCELAAMTGTFVFVTIGWVFFRAETIGKAIDYLRSIPHGFFKPPMYRSFLFLYVIPLVLLDWWFRKNEREPYVGAIPLKFARYALYSVVLFLILAHSGSNASFIYFQF
ncbi:MAG TPA: MBOAT family O-acyltransferase [Puia sp.]|nr:MBOAT family O-acyltransferase [Puia sp.]